MKDKKQKLIVLIFLFILVLVSGVLVVEANKSSLRASKAPLYHTHTAQEGGYLFSGPFLDPLQVSYKFDTQVLAKDNIRNYHDKIEEYDWNTKVAKAVMREESQMDPKNINWNDRHIHYNCAGSFGLFQLACFRGTQKELLDPEKNIEMAYEIWKKKGWRPWGVCQPPNQKVVCWY